MISLGEEKKNPPTLIKTLTYIINIATVQPPAGGLNPVLRKYGLLYVCEMGAKITNNNQNV